MGQKRPVVLLLVEGWGIAPASEGNAISEAAPKFFSELITNYPAFALEANGLEVGLKASEPGNYRAGYHAIGNPLNETLAATDVNVLAIGSPAAIGRLQESFFTQPLSNDKCVEVSGDTETNEIIRNVMSTTTNAVLEERSDLIVANVIHVDASASHGNLATTIEDISTFDEGLKDLVDAVLTKHGTLVFASSHGNAEAVTDLTTDATIGNTVNPVPCIVVQEALQGRSGSYKDSVTSDLSELNTSGSVKRVSSTVVKLLGLAVPPELEESLV